MDDDEESRARRRKGFISIFVTLAVFICPFLLGFSFAIIEPGEVGLKINYNTNTLYTDKLYGQGRHFTGLGVNFVKFPTYRIDMDIESVQARTKDGLTVHVTPSFQYSLPVDSAEKISHLFNTYGGEENLTIISLCRSSTRDIISTFNAYDLVGDREIVAEDLHRALQERLDFMHLTVTGFQLISVRWSELIDSKIMVAVEAFEDVKTAYAEKNISRIEAETSVLEATILADMTIINANRTAQLLLAEKTALSEIIGLQATAQSAGYGLVKETVAGMTSEELLKYVYLDQVVGGKFLDKKVTAQVPSKVQDELDSW